MDLDGDGYISLYELEYFYQVVNLIYLASLHAASLVKYVLTFIIFNFAIF